MAPYVPAAHSPGVTAAQQRRPRGRAALHVTAAECLAGEVVRRPALPRTVEPERAQRDDDETRVRMVERTRRARRVVGDRAPRRPHDHVGARRRTRVRRRRHPPRCHSMRTGSGRAPRRRLRRGARRTRRPDATDRRRHPRSSPRRRRRRPATWRSTRRRAHSTGRRPAHRRGATRRSWPPTVGQAHPLQGCLPPFGTSGSVVGSGRAGTEAPVTAAWMWARAELRARWRAWLLLGVLAGVTVGVAAAGWAGARRTERAVPDAVAASRIPTAALLANDPSSGPAQRAEVAKLPGVTATYPFLVGFSAQVFSPPDSAPRARRCSRSHPSRSRSSPAHWWPDGCPIPDVPTRSSSTRTSATGSASTSGRRWSSVRRWGPTRRSRRSSSPPTE